MTLARLTLSTSLAAALAAATGAAAQTYPQTSRYPPSTYDRPQTSPSQDPYDRSRPNGYAPQRDSRYGDRDGQGDQAGQEAGEPDLGRELNLRGDQRAALEAYKAAFRPDEAAARAAEDMARRLPTLTTPQRLDFTRREMERERADFERTDAATRRFYAQLTPEQRRTFDQLTAPQDEGEDGAPSASDPSGRR